MLRITTSKSTQAIVLRLEGRLEGPWVTVLEHSWRGALPKLGGRRLCVDLSDVTFVDAQGKARLAVIHAQGAELVGGDIETKALVAEIADHVSKATNDDKKHVSADTDQLIELQRLQAELHTANQELAKAARPLKQLAILNEQQRQDVGKQLRAWLARWESITLEIQQVMRNGKNGERMSTGNEGDSQ